MYDYLLKGGAIVDGTGQPAREADLAIKGAALLPSLPISVVGRQQLRFLQPRDRYSPYYQTTG